MLPICSDREERGSLKRTKTINRESQKKINTYINRRRKCFKHSIRVDRRVSEAAGIFLMLNVQRYFGTLRQCATYLFQSLSDESHFHPTLRLDLALKSNHLGKKGAKEERISHELAPLKQGSWSVVFRSDLLAQVGLSLVNSRQKLPYSLKST